MRFSFIPAAVFIVGVAIAVPPATAGTTVTSTTRTTSTVVVSSDSCVRLTKHVPSADVEYKPGEDGVAPADLGGAPAITVPKNFNIPIQIDTLANLGLTSIAGLEGKADVGTVEIRDGVAYFNGQPLTGADQQQVMYACEKALSR